jgi:hypothetical protein
MDSDSYKRENKEKPEDGDPLLGSMPLLQSIWIRHFVQDNNGLYKFLLDYHRNVLPCCGFISWVIFLFFKN